uniref:Uncharacterized protein n=1 Tax=Anguilla anguilla TaxID=7936 RepID=A0A0E9V439_ANGAN
MRGPPPTPRQKRKVCCYAYILQSGTVKHTYGSITEENNVR